MDFKHSPGSNVRPIRLDPALLKGHGRAEIEKNIRQIVRSVRFELLAHENAFLILGPEMAYHAADPYLLAGLEALRPGMNPADIFPYRSERKNFDLCLEDSWSGYFIAKRLFAWSPGENVILIHLDDHTDMMPTLLERADRGLKNPTTGEAFDPAASGDWESAIRSGCVSIGNFVTPLYYSGRRLHVRHLNNFRTSTYKTYNVTQASCSYALIPDREFAGIRKKNGDWNDSSGTYRGGADVQRVLQDIPAGRIIVHIDLDYFINDFNGNIGTNFLPASEGLPIEARRKMDRFFDGMRAANPIVDRWVIATSPGFCSAYHWENALSELDRRIEEYGAHSRTN